MGGILMVLGGLLEFILGNTYSFVAFTGFGLCPLIQDACQQYRSL
jgi:succinate-acetate transporter protein